MTALELLWSNADPYTNFDAQTISIDLSDVSACIIVFHNNNKIAQRCVNCLIFMNSSVTAIGADLSYVNRRKVTISSDGITFASAYRGPYNNSNTMIPYQIYGIKEN